MSRTCSTSWAVLAPRARQVFAFNHDLVRDVADLPSEIARSGVAPTGQVTDKPSVVRIAVAHHEQIFQDGLKLLLGPSRASSSSATPPTARAALRMVQDLRPDVLLVDLALPEGGISVLKKLATMPERVKAIALVASADEDLLIAALEQGARGVILKESPTALLFKSIRIVLADQFWIGRDSVGPGRRADAPPGAAVRAEKHAKHFKLTRAAGWRS